MNAPHLRARDIEAYALSTLTTMPDGHATGSRTANSVPVARRFRRARRVFLVGAILGLAVLAFGFLIGRVLTPTAAQMHQGPKVTASESEPPATTAKLATKRIVPADVLDSNASVLIGTGDGSSGSWARL